MIVRCERKLIGGSIEAPPSKSSMQRAVACAALAEGTSILRSGELCADSKAALGLARSLGAKVSLSEQTATIEGSDLFRREGSGEPDSAPTGTAVLSYTAASAAPSDVESASRSLDLDCGESGLCMRMFSPIAALLDRDVRLLGRGSLARRPMRMIEGPLEALGAACRTADGFAPIAIRGPLRGGAAEIDAGESSQLLTGLLIALPLAARDSAFRVINAVSRGYLDLTIDTCAAFGAHIERNADFSRFSIPGGQRYKAADFTIEGDWSGAAFLIVAAAIAAGEADLEIRGLQSGSSQPDRAVLEAVRAAGAPLRIEGERLMVGRARLRAFEFDATDCPDLFPPLAALASACGGPSVIRGTHRLKGKESDRAASLAAMLGALGVPVRLEGDAMLVEGGRVRGGEVESSGDHRIAMAAAVTALAAEAPVTIRGAECVSKSWPGFFEDLASIGR